MTTQHRVSRVASDEFPPTKIAKSSKQDPVVNSVVSKAVNQGYRTVKIKYLFTSLSYKLTNYVVCPLDGTLLQIQLPLSTEDVTYFRCSTCLYSCKIEQRVQTTNFSKNKKQVDDILGGAAAWENVDRTAAVCPKCSHGEAYFLQMQIRSADEPMSVFYKCVNCSFQWNDK